MNRFKSSVAIAAAIALLTITGATAIAAGSTSGPAPVDLGSAGKFVILSKAGITTTGTTRITASGWCWIVRAHSRDPGS